VVIINEGKLMAAGSLEELTASVQEKDGVFIRLREGGKEKVEHFQDIPGVDKVSIRDDGYKIEWTRGNDSRDDITRYIVERNWGLLEMRSLAMDIEELYLRVITGETEQ
jgi:ABC-2 type transport system ATP-binding protein